MMEHILYEELWQKIIKEVFPWFKAQKTNNKCKEIDKWKRYRHHFHIRFSWVSNSMYLIPWGIRRNKNFGYKQPPKNVHRKISFSIEYYVTT